MPAPGATALASAMQTTITVPKVNKSTTIRKDGETIKRLSQALNDGWIPLYPTTLSIVTSKIPQAFSGYLKPAYPGYAFMMCIAQGIDAEMALWVASWNPVLQVHSYAPSATSIYNAIYQYASQIPIGPHIQPFIHAIADAWMQYFKQEEG